MSDRWGPIGYGNVPEGQRGWDGNWGVVPIQGPMPRPADWVDPVPPEAIAAAEVITSWVCPFCKADNDVSGEGAVGSWMECSNCLRDAWLAWP